MTAGEKAGIGASLFPRSDARFRGSTPTCISRNGMGRYQTRVISLSDFVTAAITALGRGAVTAETWLWRDIGIFGDEWDDFILNTLDALGVDADADFNVYNYIPMDEEVAVFGGKLIADRTIPDLRVRELYAFLEFKPRV